MKTWKWLVGGALAALLFSKKDEIVATAQSAASDLSAAALALTSKVQFVQTVWGAIANALPFLSVDSRLIILAHAMYESGWGKAKAFQTGNNLFNLTAGKSWTGPTTKSGDTEYDAAGNVKNIVQTWRAYPNVEDCVVDYWNFLGMPRYEAQGVRAQLEAGNLAGFVSALSRGGYFTLPADQYLNTMAGVYSSVSSILGVA